MKKILTSLFIITLLFSATSRDVYAVSQPPSQVAETIRASLFFAQMNLPANVQVAEEQLAQAETAYNSSFGQTVATANLPADENIRSGFAQMHQAIEEQSLPDFAAGRALVWTSILNGSYSIVEHAVREQDVPTAQSWLTVREFRTATRFSRPNADATLALKDLAAQAITADDALQFLRADLFDTYQARLNEGLRDLESADQNDFAVRRAELTGLAWGYFRILAPAYLEQRGASALDEVQGLFADLQAASVSGTEIQPILGSVENALENFRAAPLSPAEQSRRAGQLLRYVNLVSVEYERGVSDGQVIKQLEIQEAMTFYQAGLAAFDDLRDLLNGRDAESTEQAARLIEQLGTQLENTTKGTSVASPEEVRKNTEALVTVLGDNMPEEWKKGSTAGDFDVVDSMLDQMEIAIRTGDYELAESARLEAYAVLESGPEGRLTVVAPQSKLAIEDLFWNGQGEYKGLSYLIERNAPLSEIKASRDALDAELNTAERILSVQSAPLATMSNAGIIVFREGLEAVVILASLMGSMKTGETRKYRRPMWWGAGLAMLATVITWMLAHGILVSLARYGEKLEAIVSIIAIAVLLLITNWFFHNTYWTDWIAAFQSRKKRLLTGETGLLIGLISLGFTSVYREGFETVLFLQALVLDSGTAIVLTGVAAGLLATILVGFITFKIQARLHYMNMLIITGVLIGGVLLIMVGKTVHVLQVVGWMSTSPISGVSMPYWVGMWFGTYPTWEGIILQIISATFVIGSYYLAEGMRKKKLRAIEEKAHIVHEN